MRARPPALPHTPLISAAMLRQKIAYVWLGLAFRVISQQLAILDWASQWGGQQQAGWFRHRGGRDAAVAEWSSRVARMDTLGIEPRASRMLSGCDTTTPRALECISHSLGSSTFAKRDWGSGHKQTPHALLPLGQTGELLQTGTLGHVAWSSFFTATGNPGLGPTMGWPTASWVVQAQRGTRCGCSRMVKSSGSNGHAGD